MVTNSSSSSSVGLITDVDVEGGAEDVIIAGIVIGFSMTTFDDSGLCFIADFFLADLLLVMPFVS